MQTRLVAEAALIEAGVEVYLGDPPAEALLAEALDRRWGAAWRSRDIERDCGSCGDLTHGKPHIPELDGSFSLSRAGDLCAVAVAEAAVGIDVEPLQPWADVAELAPAMLTTAEQQLLNRVPPRLQSAWLLGAWTAKEAYLKAVGVGLATDPRTVEVGSVSASWSTVGVGTGAPGGRVAAVPCGSWHVGTVAVAARHSHEAGYGTVSLD